MMAHVTNMSSQGGRDGCGGTRREKQRRDMELWLGSGGRRSRPKTQRHSAGMAMGAYRGTSVPISLTSSESADRSPTCNRQHCVGVMTILGLLVGATLLACGLLNPGSIVVGLCLSGGLIILTILITCCVAYLWQQLRGNGRGATYRQAATADDVTVNMGPSTVASSFGPDPAGRQPTANCHQPGQSLSDSRTNPPPQRSFSDPPSTPPPPYDEVT